MNPLQEALHFITHESRLFNKDETPFKCALYDGDPRFVLILGDNATGKSLAARMLSYYIKDKHKLKTLPISIRERVGDPENEMSSFAKAMMFGSEREQSTGSTTISTILHAFPQIDSSKDGYDVLSLDEPELGLSEAFHAPLAQLILNGFHDGASIVLTTHSRRLVRTISLTLQPTLLSCFHDVPKDLQTWLQDDTDRSLQDLINLPEIGHAGKMAVYTVLKK